MTSIEYLFNELWEAPKDKFTWHSILNKAKEMHKQEIKDAWEEGESSVYITSGEIYTDGDAEQYYQETFVSKGSDKISKVAENTSFDNLPKVQNKDSFGEISDEEIKKTAIGMGIASSIATAYFIDGAKWYREQLKQRNNG
jgi:hypothetical protein